MEEIKTLNKNLFWVYVICYQASFETNDNGGPVHVGQLMERTVERQSTKNNGLLRYGFLI